MCCLCVGVSFLWKEIQGCFFFFIFFFLGPIIYVFFGHAELFCLFLFCNFFFPLLSSVNHSSASNYPAQESFNVSFASGFCAFSWQTAARGCGGEPGVPRWAQAPWLLKSIPRACELPAETFPALCPRSEVHRCLTSVKTFLLLKKKNQQKKQQSKNPTIASPGSRTKVSACSSVFLSL